MDVEEEEEDAEVEEADVEEEDRSQDREAHFVRACAVEMHMHIAQGGNLQGKCRTLIPGQAFCGSLRSRNAHGHVTRAILCGNLQGKCRLPSPRTPDFVGACEVEMHMDMSEEAFCMDFWREIYSENAKRPGYHLDWTP